MIKWSRFYYNLKFGVPLRKPKLGLRIARNYFNILLRRLAPLRYIDVCVNLECNLKCAHCFKTDFEHEKEGKSPLTVAEWKSVIRQCMDLGTIAVGITGGELMLYPHLEELIQASFPDRMLIILNTNGTLLTLKRAKGLYQLGVDIVQISLDSALEEEHDRFRGKRGTFQKALEGIDHALAAGLKVTIVPTVSHFNVYSEGFNRLISLAQQKGALLNLSLAAATGEWAGMTDCLLRKDEIEYLNSLVRKHPHVRRDFETNYWTQGCGAATEKLYITVFGDVLPCPYMHISFGNVRNTEVAKIRHNMFTVPELNGYYPACLVAEDHTFINKYLLRDSEGTHLPPWTTVFPQNP